MRRLLDMTESEYEAHRHEQHLLARQELDRRTEVGWVEAEPGTRCGHRRVVARSGRLARCSEDAAWLKLRTYDDGWCVPAGFFCPEHAPEHGGPS